MDFIDAKREEYPQIEEIYLEAFPIEEQAPFSFMIEKLEKGLAILKVTHDNEKVIGFMYIATVRDVCYLYYFAVRKSYRGQGIGSHMLKELFEQYENWKIFITVEPLDETAENNTQRIQRKNFYHRNGFIDNNRLVKEGPCVFEILSNGPIIQAKDYYDILYTWSENAMFVKVKYLNE